MRFCLPALRTNTGAGRPACPRAAHAAASLAPLPLSLSSTATSALSTSTLIHGYFLLTVVTKSSDPPTLLPIAVRGRRSEWGVVKLITILEASRKLHMPQSSEVAFKLSLTQLQSSANCGRRQGPFFFAQLEDPLLNIGQLPGLATGIPGSIYRPGITRNGLNPLLQITILA